MGGSGQTIINADDLGISLEVNEAIFDAFDRGVVSSATVIANAPALDAACSGAKARPGLGVGIHLNTSQFRPLTAAFERFRAANPETDLRTVRWLSPSDMRAIGEEWTAQISRVRDLGVNPTHLDSHHFDHVNPILLPQLARVARASGIARVRGMQNLSLLPKGRSVTAAKRAHRLAMRAAGLRTTSYMADATTWMALAKKGLAPTEGTCEVMCHPGHADYARETAELLDDPPLDERPITWASIH